MAVPASFLSPVVRYHELARCLLKRLAFMDAAAALQRYVGRTVMSVASARRGDYLWRVSSDVPRLVEALVMHHRNARLFVTSFDSGQFIPGSGELASGWTFVNGIAVSPPLSDKLSLPTAGFDEWYVFDELPGPTFIPEVFVNYVPFPLEIPPVPSTGSLDETDQWRSDAVDRFWRQLESFRPISYVARADSDVVVTRRERFMQDVSASG